MINISDAVKRSALYWFGDDTTFDDKTKELLATVIANSIESAFDEYETIKADEKRNRL